MPLIYHVAIEDESINPDEPANIKPATKWIGFSTNQISHNLITRNHGLHERPGPAD